MPSARAKTIVAGLVILGAAAFLFAYLHPSPPRPEVALHEGIGQVLAEEAAKLMRPGGTVTLIARDAALFDCPAAEYQMQGFLRTAAKARLKVGTTNWIKLDPLRLVRVPPGDFLVALLRQREGGVVVSLLGPPLLSTEQRAQLGESRPKVVAFCSGDVPRHVNLRELFDLGLLHVAIISRPSPPLTKPDSKNPRAWFDHYYQVITPANLAGLPEPSVAAGP